MRKLLKASLLGGMVMLATTINPLTHAEEPVFTGVTYDTVNGTITITYDGKSITMQDRNVGATEVGFGENASTGSYGLYYQWRGTTGFEYNQSSGDAIKSGFVKGNTAWAEATTGIRDWRQGPCSSGYHIPTSEEWQQVIDMYTEAENATGAFYNAFKIPFAGYRNYSALMRSTRTYAQLWSASNRVGANANLLTVNNSGADNSFSINRASALPIRCFKDEEPVFTGVTWNESDGTITITDGENSIVMKDKNVGATSTDTTSSDSYGYHYQRGGMTGYDYKLTPDEAINLGFDSNWTSNGWTKEQEVQICGNGYHIPTKEERDFVESTLQYNVDVRGALKIPSASYRDYNNAEINGGRVQYLWSSSFDEDDSAYVIGFGMGYSTQKKERAIAAPIRCFKNIPTPVAKINSDEYLTLNEALEAANEGDTIVIIKDIIVDHDIDIKNSVSLKYESNVTIKGKLKLYDLNQLIPVGNSNLIINGGNLFIGEELLIGGEGAIFTLGDGIDVEIKNKKIDGVNYLRLDFDGSKDISPITVNKSYTIDEGNFFHFGDAKDINLTINEPITVKGMIYAEFEHTTGRVITKEAGDLNELKNTLSIQGDVSFDLNNSLKLSMTLHDGSSFPLPGTGDFGELTENGINLSEFLGELDISIVIEDGAIITLPVGQKIGPTDNLKAIKDGYTFDGWFIDEGLSTPFEFDTTYDKDITLYPKFTKIPDPTPTPSYSGGGGSRRGSSVSKSEDNKKVDEENNISETHNSAKSELELAYEFAYKNGITTMDSIEKAELDQPLTRIAMAKMLSQYAMNVLGKVPANMIAPRFEDITPELNNEYNGGSELAYQLSIMGLNMPDNKFRPFDLVTRAEFGTALSRLLYGLSDGEGLYYETHLAKLKNEGIITNDTPDLEEARGYIMLMLMRSANK